MKWKDSGIGIENKNLIQKKTTKQWKEWGEEKKLNENERWWQCQARQRDADDDDYILP